MYEPMKCPICEKAWVRFTYYDSEGQHWNCPNCGSSDQNYTVFYTNTTNSTLVIPGVKKIKED